MRIVLISDTHLAPGAGAFLDNCRAAVRWIEACRADLIVHLGDITADGVKDPFHFAAASQVLSALSAPLLATPGNHDVGETAPKGGVDEPPLDLDRLALFRRTFGPDAWVCRRDGWTLIGLDSQVFGDPDAVARQWAWLDGALDQAEGPIGLFLHKPVFHATLQASDDNPRYARPEARSALAARFKDLDLRFVASGHVHQALTVERDGVLHVWAPSTAFILPDSVQDRLGDKMVGLTLLDLDGRDVEASFVVPPGMQRHNVLDHADVYPQVAGLRDARDGLD